MPSMLYSIKEMARVAYAQSPNVKLVDETTNDDPWGPTGQQMDEVCRSYRLGGDTAEEILCEIVLRLEHRKDSWRRCYKSLLLLDHMARTLPERYVRDLDRVTPLLGNISRSFYHTDSKGVDQGVNVRERAKKLLTLLQDRELLASERAKSAATAAKVGGIGSHGTGGGMGGDFGGGGNFSSRFGGTGSNMHAVSADAGGGIASRQSTYGGSGGGGSYDAYIPRNAPRASVDTASPPPPPTTHPSGRPFTKEEQEEADMAYAARLQQEEERRAGTRVSDTDIGRRMANEGHFQQVQQQQQRRAAQSQQQQQQQQPAVDAETRMAQELQARLDRGEDMETAIATITAKYNKASPSPSAAAAPPSTQQGAAPRTSQQQQHQQAPAVVVDPFAVPHQHPNQQQQHQQAGGSDLDFFSDIPQGNLVHKNAPAQQQQQNGGRPAGHAAGGFDAMFGGATTSQQQQQPPPVQQQHNAGGMDFFGNSAAQQTSHLPPQQFQQQQPQPQTLDFFGNPTPQQQPSRPAAATSSNANTFGDDFFATPSPANTSGNGINNNTNAKASADPFAALSQAQQQSIDALSGGTTRQQPVLGQANQASRAPVW